MRDSMSLATSSCAVCKDRGIVSVEHAVKEAFRGSFVDIVLGGIVVKNPVKGERLVLDAFSLWTNSIS
jgi:hypothetical protein